MCIINNSYQFVFVHVPKAAGTSITNVLSQYTNYCDIELGGTEFGEAIQPHYTKRFGLSKHSTAAAIRTVVGEDVWSGFYKFSFVRNPFSRCLSTFHFLRKWEGPSSEFNLRMREFESFDEYVLSDMWVKSAGPDNIFRPQITWLQAAPQSIELLTDYVGKVETLDEDLGHILDVIGIPENMRPDSGVPQLNQSRPSDISEIRDEKVIQRIVEKYKLDFDAFGYSKEPQ